MKKQEKLLLFFLLFGLAVIRLYHVNFPSLEIEESWRQADTESMAWNYVKYDANPFHPNLNYDGPLPNIPALEIQVTTYLISLLYRLFGHQYFLARLVPLMFFILSGVFLYAFARNYMKTGAALISLLIYGILPLNVYYSRAIMPESAALMFWTGGFYFFDKWLARKKNLQNGIRYLLLSSVLTALAIMTKPPVILIAIPMIYLCFQYFQRRWLRFPELWGYAFVILTVPAIYYCYSTKIAEFKFTVGITQYIFRNNFWNIFYSHAACQFYSTDIPRSLGLIALLLAVIGIFFISRRQTVILVWFIAMLLEVIFFVSAVRAAYYLIFFTVPCALLIGNFLYRICSEPTGKILAVLLVSVIALESLHLVRPMFAFNTVLQNQVKVVQNLTKTDDLIVVGSLDPCLLSSADRRGWRYNLGIYAATPADPEKELKDYIERGAKYFVPIQGKIYGDESGELLKKIENQFSKIEPIKGYPIFQLR
ncbi:MAG: hypothetical protein AWM53_00176 [Candidatus Dichloromethanomonas elyunquensis]|nr:MAG: hypothetical protein AWM53_00176 [Candidatus Dichloromethanomonas elyunquensis]